MGGFQAWQGRGCLGWQVIHGGCSQTPGTCLLPLVWLLVWPAGNSLSLTLPSPQALGVTVPRVAAACLPQQTHVPCLAHPCPVPAERQIVPTEASSRYRHQSANKQLGEVTIRQTVQGELAGLVQGATLMERPGSRQTGFNSSYCKLNMAPDTKGREAPVCSPCPYVSAWRELASWTSGQMTFHTLSLCPDGIPCANHRMVTPGLPRLPVIQDAVGTLWVAHTQTARKEVL